MADISALQLSFEDQATLVAAFQAESDKYIEWKRAAQEKVEVEKRIREKYMNKLEANSVAENKRDGIFINTNRRPDLKQIIEDLKDETGIVFTSALVYHALKRWWKELNLHPRKMPPL